MKKLLFLFSLIPALAFGAGAQTNGPIKIVFSWFPDPTQMGGLSTNDYMTNIVGFHLYTTANLTPPVNWTLLTNLPPAIGTQTNLIASNPTTTFYSATAVANSGESFFSNTAAWVSLPAGGSLQLFKGP